MVREHHVEAIELEHFVIAGFSLRKWSSGLEFTTEQSPTLISNDLHDHYGSKITEYEIIFPYR